MADEAKVRSVDSLEFFRSALIVFLSRARKAVHQAEDGVKRSRYWVEQEQQSHWTQEWKKRSRKLSQAQQELLTAQRAKFQDSVMLQEKLMRRARDEVLEAEEKLKNIKRWSREFDRVFDPALKGLNQLSDSLEHDMPRAIAWMEQALRTLGAYLERERPADFPSPSAAGGGPDNLSEANTP